MKLTPVNEIERKVLEMVRNGEPIHGLARDILEEMTIRAIENQKKDCE